MPPETPGFHVVRRSGPSEEREVTVTVAVALTVASAWLVATTW